MKDASFDNSSLCKHLEILKGYLNFLQKTRQELVTKGDESYEDEVSDLSSKILRTTSQVAKARIKLAYYKAVDDQDLEHGKASSIVTESCLSCYTNQSCSFRSLNKQLHPHRMDKTILMAVNSLYREEMIKMEGSESLMPARKVRFTI